MRSRAAMALAVVVVLVLGSYVLYTQRVVSRLRVEAAREGRMYARVYRALSDTAADGASQTAALLDLANHIRESGVPVVITDARGVPTQSANTPFDGTTDADTIARLAEFARQLDLENEPLLLPQIGTLHFGHTPLVKELRVVPLLQSAFLALLLGAAVYGFRTRARADRERVWAGMARESAHQLGTPLSSLSGWIELLRERESDALTAHALTHMEGDLERLERVAHRFERIGRPARREPVDVATIAERVANYFRARVPSLAHSVHIDTKLEPGATIAGDAVLIEWGLESLLKNAIDALAGRGGRVQVTVERTPEAVRVVVADDGPGVPRELRKRIFDAGFTTKQGGWGLGLALTRRIVTESHGGAIALVPTDRGATFQITFPA
ncbi:MAG: HAMP domain-containing histidine kinase [Gemmatimonadetes bacterium]|nr:HAMP domain-containing histidine kinase [Gemmatimonadota bacterium]